MQKGDYVKVPRFKLVQIHEVITAKQAEKRGYNEMTFYDDGKHFVLGRWDGKEMKFAAIKR